MHLSIQVWLIGGAIVVLTVATCILVAMVKHRMLMHHLSFLAEDIHAAGRDTLKKESIRCTFCKSKSHVHIWQYGLYDKEHDRLIEVLLCSRCASRVAKFLELPAILKGNQSPYVQQRRQSVFRS